MNAIIETIDTTIKQTWIDEISKDYETNYLLKEDTFKNAFYHHLRSRLDNMLKENNLRIYTEFNECGLKTRRKRADLAIVKMKDEPGISEYLIHEHKYNHSELQWLGEKQYNNWAKGRLTELNACYYEERPDDGIGFSVCSYNSLNPGMERKELADIIFVKL